MAFLRVAAWHCSLDGHTSTLCTPNTIGIVTAHCKTWRGFSRQF